MAENKSRRMFWRLHIFGGNFSVLKMVCWKYMASDILDDKWYQDNKSTAI